MSDGRWLTVGEACRALGVSRTTLLAAEDAALITPVRTPGGHRRYAAAELQRYLGVGVVPDPPPTRPATGPPRGVADIDLAATVRAAVRPLTRALDGESAGLYLVDGDGLLRLAGSFGVPRWLAERLADGPPPAHVTAALAVTRTHLFDPAATGFPDPRSTGHGAAVGLHVDDHPAGVLFLVTRTEHGLLPMQIRVVEAVAEVLALLVGQHRRAAALQDRLDRVAAACAG